MISGTIDWMLGRIPPPVMAVPRRRLLMVVVLLLTSCTTTPDTPEVTTSAASLGASTAAVGKVAPPAPGMNLTVEVDGERLRGNEWSLTVPSGGQLALGIVGRIPEDAADGQLKLRLDDTRDGYRTVTTYLMTADAKAGEQRFSVNWVMEDSGGRSIEPGRLHLIADLDTATSRESAGLGYVVITE